VRAVIDVDSLRTQISNPHTLQSSAHDDLPVRSAHLASGDAGPAERTGKTIDLANYNLEELCGKSLSSNLTAGTQEFVSSMFNVMAGYMTQRGHGPDAAEMRTIIKRPIA